MKGDHPMRRCGDCPEHSKVESEIDTAKSDIKDLKNQLFKIYIIVLSGLITGLFTFGTTLYITMDSKINKINQSHQENDFKGLAKIDMEFEKWLKK